MCSFRSLASCAREHCLLLLLLLLLGFFFLSAALKMCAPRICSRVYNIQSIAMVRVAHVFACLYVLSGYWYWFLLLPRIFFRKHVFVRMFLYTRECVVYSVLGRACRRQNDEKEMGDFRSLKRNKNKTIDTRQISLFSYTQYT